jgi:hypothetical protein
MVTDQTRRRSRANAFAHSTGVWAACGIFSLVLLINIDRAPPVYDWDLIGYLAVANSFTLTDASAIHARTYQSLQREIPSRQYEALTDPNDSIRATVAESPETLFHMIPLYSVKPLYPAMMYIVAATTGLSYIDSSTLISRLAYVGIALIVAAWLRRLLNIYLALLLAGLIVSFPPMLRLAQYSTPDALSVFLCTSSMYLAAERQRPVTALVLGVLCITARPDNIALVLPFALVLFVIGKPNRTVIGLTAAVAMATYVMQSVLTGNPGWKVTFYRAFIAQQPMAGLTGDPVPLSLNTYLQVLHRQYSSMLDARDYVLIFLLLGAIALLRCLRRFGMSDLYTALLAASIANIGVHLVSFPRELDRFLVGTYTVIVLSAIAVLTRVPPRTYQAIRA